MESASRLLERVRLSKQKRFLGIEPCAARWHVLSGFNIHRLGLTIIKAVLEQAGWEVVNHYEKIGGPLFEQNIFPLCFPYTVVGISTITPTALRAYELARKIKQINPRTLVLMGGFHPTACPDEALDYADFVIRGEGERTIEELLCSALPVEDIRGISYWRGGMKKHNPERPLLQALSYPVPLLDPNLSCEPPLLFGRGCPYKCEFCAVSQVMGSKMRMRPLQEVVRELKLLAERGAKEVFFVDDNFFGDLEQAVALLELIVKEGIKLSIVIQMRPDTKISSNLKILSLMKKAGIILLCTGIEFVEDASLKRVHKGVSVEKVIEFVTVMRQWCFSFYAMFIFGSLRDRLDTPARILAFMRRYLPHEILQIMHLTPLPGTKFYQDIKAQIFDENWANYDGSRVLWHHPHMQPREQYQVLLQAYKAWYGPANIGQILRQKVLSGQLDVVIFFRRFIRGVRRTINDWERLLAEG